MLPEIRIYPDEALRKVAEPVEVVDEEIKDIIDQMIAVTKVYRAHGLAAPQIGVNKRIFVINTEEEPEVLINPEITERYGETKMKEGCLSFPGVEEVIARAEEVTITYLDREGEERNMSLDGLDAVAAQHELDHLDGVLFIDHISQFKKRMMLKKLKKSLDRMYPKKKKKTKAVYKNKIREQRKKERKRKKKSAA